MKHRASARLFLVPLWLLAGWLIRPAAALELQQQLIAPRVWFVDWNFGGFDLGQSPLLMLNYNAQYADWHFQLLGGYGEAWESDPISDDFIRDQGGDPAARKRSRAEADRFDVQWQIGRKFSMQGIEDAFNFPVPLGPIYVGLAYHYIEFNFDSPLGDAEVYYHSPELLLGLSQNLGVPGLYFRGHLTYMAYVRWATESPEFLGKDEGDTDGLLWDAGLVYQLQGDVPLHLSAGYRALEVAEDGSFEEDDFKGFYVELGLHW